MRPATPFRLLLAPAVLFAAACDDTDTPLEPPAAADEAPLSEAPATLASGRWADGYLWAHDKTVASYTPSSPYSFNGSGGRINLTKVAGTTGRYVARFSGLSPVLGTKSTLHVSGFGYDATYCKPVGARLVRDSVEVRCFKMGTGAAANASFTLMVSDTDAGAFAYAHQPTATNYSPAASGSWNPGGAIRVYRDGVGQYRVVFAGLGIVLSPAFQGHVQVNAVGTGKAYCKAGGWGGSPNLTVTVGCYTAAGTLVDAKFTALFTASASHLAYAWAEAPVAASYSAAPAYSSNPAQGPITIKRQATGRYSVRWAGVNPQIIESGSVQVTAWGEGDAQCKPAAVFDEDVTVQCFAANGVPMDAQFLVLFHS